MKTAAALFAAFFLGSCAMAPPVPYPPELRFDAVAPVQLDAVEISILNKYVPPAKAPNVEHLFKTPPARAAEALIKKQLVPLSGSPHVLRVTIEDASVIREDLPLKRGVEGLLTQEAEARLSGRVLIRFELADASAPDIATGEAKVLATRTRTLLEGMTIAERDRAYYELTQELMKNVSDGLSTVVKSSFGIK